MDKTCGQCKWTCEIKIPSQNKTHLACRRVSCGYESNTSDWPYVDGDWPACPAFAPKEGDNGQG